jgi:hypothetical protein
MGTYQEDFQDHKQRVLLGKWQQLKHQQSFLASINHIGKFTTHHLYWI